MESDFVTLHTKSLMSSMTETLASFFDISLFSEYYSEKKKYLASIVLRLYRNIKTLTIHQSTEAFCVISAVDVLQMTPWIQLHA